MPVSDLWREVLRVEPSLGMRSHLVRRASVFFAVAVLATLLPPVLGSTPEADATTAFPNSLHVQVSDATAGIKTYRHTPSLVSRDGRFVVYEDGDMESDTPKWVMVWDQKRDTSFPVWGGSLLSAYAISPNGRWILVDVNLPIGGGADGVALTLVENPAIRPNGRAYGIKGMSIIGWDRTWGAWDVSDDGDVALVTTASMVAEDTGAGYGLDAYLWRRPKQGAQGTWQLLTQDENGQAVNSNGVGAGIAVSSNGSHVAFVTDGNPWGGDGSNPSGHNLYIWSESGITFISRVEALSEVDMSRSGRYIVAETNVNPINVRLSRFDLGAPVDGEFIAAPLRESVTTSPVSSGSHPTVSDDGRFVAFREGLPDRIWLRDMHPDTGQPFTLVNHRHDDKTERASGSATAPQISGNGHTVVFASDSDDLLPGDTSGDWDVFAWWSNGLPPTKPFTPRTYLTTFAGAAKDNAGSQGDPVNSWSGAYEDAVVDLVAPSPGVAFSLERGYSSAVDSAGTLGQGWSQPYEARLSVRSDTSVTVSLGNGGELVYHPSAGGGYSSDDRVAAILEDHPSGGWLLRLPDGRQLEFDNDGALVAFTDRNGLGLSFTPNSDGLPGAFEDESGRTGTFSYDGDGRLTEVELSDGRSVSYSYNASGLLESFTDVRGNTTTYTYDANGRLLTETDANGHVVVANTYGPDGRVVANTEAAGAQHLYDWDADELTSTYTDGRGNVWVDAYDEVGNLVARTDGSGNTTSYDYDEAGNLVELVDPAGGVTAYTHDGAGRVLTETGPVPDETRAWSYHPDGSLASHTDGEGHVTVFSYTDGLLTRIDHPDGTFETFTYTDGLLTAHTNEAGKTTSYTHDTSGNVISTTTPEGRVTTFAYDDAGRVISRVDPRGNEPGADPDDYRWTFTYDPAGNPLTSRSPEGRESSFSYDDVGNRVTATTAEGSSAEASMGWTYDEGNWPVAVTDPVAATTTWAYDAAGNRTARIDGSDRETAFVFDDANRHVGTTAPSGAATTVEVDELGRPTRVVDARGNHVPAPDPVYTPVTPTRLLDTRQQTLGKVRPGQGTNNRPVTVTGVAGIPSEGVGAVVLNVTAVTPDNNGYLTLYPAGATRPNTSNVNYAAGKTVATMAVVEVGDGGGVLVYSSGTTHVVVDVAGWFAADGSFTAAPSRQLDTRTGAGSKVAANTSKTVTVAGVGGVPLDAGAVVAQITVVDGEASGYATAYTAGTAKPGVSTLNYPATRATSNLAFVKPNAEGKIAVYLEKKAHLVVDVVGWVAAGEDYTPITPARLLDTRTGGARLNNAWRDVTVAGAAGIPNEGVAAVALNVTAVSPTNSGYLTVYPAGSPRPGVSTLNYDSGDVVANAAVTTVGYVSGDGKVRVYSSGATHVLIDVVGWFAEQEVPTASGLGVNFSYDEAGRLLEVDYDDPGTPDVTYTYDGRGLRTQMVDGRGTTTYVYDERGRLAELDGPDGTFSYTYDEAGRVLTRGFPDGRTLTYTYDDDGLPTTVSDGTHSTSYGWDADGNLTSIVSPNGAVETRGYDADGHLVSQQVVSAGTTLVDKHFTVDDAGRTVRVDDTASGADRPVTTYSYDAAGRLVEECHQASCDTPADPYQRWTYDGAGRRLTETTPAGTATYDYDVDGNLEATTGPDGTTTYTYDPAGRRVAETGPDGSRSYRWDAGGRLASVTDSSGVTVFGYDGDGTRTSVSGPDGDVQLTWDPNGALPQPVQVTVADGTTTTATELAWGAVGAPAWADVDGTLQVFHTDQVWNPTVATDTAGELTHSWTHDAWGANRTVTTMHPTAPDPTLGFSSTLPAAASADGLVHMRARDYDPTVGQFLTPDPWVRPDGQPWVGVHAYVDGNPVSFWDPDGLRPKYPMRNAFNNAAGWLWNAYRWGLRFGSEVGHSTLAPVHYQATRPGMDVSAGGCFATRCRGVGVQDGTAYWYEGEGAGFSLGVSVGRNDAPSEHRSCTYTNVSGAGWFANFGESWPDLTSGGSFGVGGSVSRNTNHDVAGERRCP